MKRLISICFVAILTLSLCNAFALNINERQLKPKVAKNEIKEQRGRNVKYYDRGHGIKTAVISASSSHYQDETGNWQDVSTAIQTNTKGAWNYQSIKNTIKAYWNADQMAVADGDESIRLELKGYSTTSGKDIVKTERNKTATTSAIQNQLVYKDVFSNASEIYCVAPDKVCFGLQVNDKFMSQIAKGGQLEYELYLSKGMGLFKPNGEPVKDSYETNGNVIIRDNEKGTQKYIRPFGMFLKDSAKAIAQCISKYIVENDGSVKILVIIPENLKTKSSIIDTFSIKSAIEKYYPVADAAIYEGSPDIVQPAYSYYLYVGVDSSWFTGGNTYLARSVIKYDISAIPADVVIRKATLRLNFISRYGLNIYSNTPHKITVYPLSVDWCDTNISWNRIGANYYKTDTASIYIIPDTVVGKEYSWSVTAIVNKWYKGTIHNYGFMLDGYGDGKIIIDEFYSKESYYFGPDTNFYDPQLEIDYSCGADLVSDSTPDGWSAPIIVSHTPNAVSSDNIFSPEDSVYISANVYNRLDTNIVDSFSNAIYADTQIIHAWSCPGGLPAQTSSPCLDVRYCLKPGINVIKTVADVNGDIQETDEDNNECIVNIKANRPPYACFTDSPAVNNIDVQLQPIFYWHYPNPADPDGDTVVNFRIQIATDSLFAGVVCDKWTGSGNCFWTYDGYLSLKTAYYWRIRATDGQTEQTTWSNVNSFTTTDKILVSGTVKYENNNYGIDSTRPLSKVKIEFYDLSINLTTPLDTATTDEYGNFNFGLVNGFNVNNSTNNLRLKLILKNNAVCDILDGQTTGNPAMEIWLPPLNRADLIYSSDGSIYYNKSINSEYTGDQIYPENNKDLAACYIYDAIYKERDYFKTQAAVCNPNLLPINVYFKYSSIDSISSFEVDNTDQRIKITAVRCVMLSDGTPKPGFYGSSPFHEYAHAVMYNNYKNPTTGAYGVFPGGQAPKKHCPYDTTTPAEALIEGWAEFAPCAVNNSTSYLYYWNDSTQSKVENIETNTWHAQIKYNPDSTKSDRIEGTVASVLWDIYDSNNGDEAGCEMTKNINTIFSTLQRNVPGKTWGLSLQPEGLEQIYLTWDSLERPKLKNIFRNHWYDRDKLYSSIDAGERIIHKNNVFSGNITTLTATVVDTENNIPPHTGDKMYKIEGQDNNTGDSYAWWEYMNNLDIPLSPDAGYAAKYLSFWIYVAEAPGSGGYIGLDLVTKKKGSIKDYSYNGFCITDQYGQRLNPAFRAVPKGQWLHYVYDLSVLNPSIYPNDTLSQILIGYDDGDPAETGYFLAYVDDIEINHFPYPILANGSVVDSTTVRLTWTDNNSDENGFLVWWKLKADSTFTVPPITADSVPGSGGTGSCLVTGLTTGQTYNFMVRSKRSDQISAYEWRYPIVTLALPEKPAISTVVLDYNSEEDKPIIKSMVSGGLFGTGTTTYYDIERKIGVGGDWQCIATKQEPYNWEYLDKIDFNNDYYYRSIAVNGMGKSDYSTIYMTQVYFMAPQLLSVTPGPGHFYIEWKDTMKTLESGVIEEGEEDSSGIIPQSIAAIGNPYYDGVAFYYKKATDSTWQMAYYPDAGMMSDFDLNTTLSPMTTYNVKIARVWINNGRLVYTPFTPTVDVFVPKSGYTNYSNARRLFRGGDNKLNATFYDGAQIYWASSINNGLSWSVANPKNGNNSTIAEKRSNNSVYSVRIKNDSLLLDSLGTTSGFGKVIKTGKKMFNPAIATDTLGNIHCVWAETTLTVQNNGVSGVPNYTVSFTVKIYYAKRTSGVWQPIEIINPIVSGSGTDLSYPKLPLLYIPHPSITTIYSGTQVIPKITWEHQHVELEGLFINKDWIRDTLAVYYSTGLNTGTRISAAGLVAEYPCLGVNPGGQLALTYQQSGDIYRITNNGTTWSTPYNVSNNTGSSQMPTVAYDKGGAMHILWYDDSESGFVQKTSTLPAGTDAKLAIAKLTELPQGEESIVWEDSGKDTTNTVSVTLSKTVTTEELTATESVPQIFYRRYKDNAWSPTYRLTASEDISVYPALPLTDDAAQMGFLWTEGNYVKYKRLPDLDGPTVTVTYPNGGEVLYSGRRYNITWSSTDNRGIKEYALYYTTNYMAQDDPTAIDAVTLWRPVATVPGNLNSYSWRVPYNVASNACRFKIVAYDSSGNIATDISDKSFTIKSRDIAVVVTDKAIAYNNAGKIARSSDGLLHVCYNGIDSVYYMASSDDGQTWATSLALDKGSLPTIATDSKNMPAMAWIKQWDNIAGGGVFFSRQTAAGWTAPETLAYMQGVLWDYIGGYSPPAMTIKNDTVSIVYEYSYGGGIPPHIAKGWALHHTRFAVNNVAGKKDTTIDSYTEIINPPIWQTPASASIATDYKGYDHISWHRTDKVYYRIRKPDGNYGNIVKLSGSGIAQNPCISISGVASAVWVEEGDIYQRTGFDQKWETAINVSASGASSMMPYICGSDVLWTEDVLSDYEVYLSSYSTAKMTYDVSENLSCTDYASIFPHETKLQTNEGTKTYRIWAEEIEPEVLWGLTFMADTTELEPTYALDVGQAEPSIFTVQRDGYITYGTAAKAKNTVTEPFKTVDYDTTALIYSFDNFDPDKKYKITLSFYQETGQEIKLKPIVNKLPLGEIKVTSGEEAILGKPLPEASYKDGQITLTIEKIKGPIAVCGKILIYENPQGNGNGGAQSAEITSITPNYINKLYQNCPNPFSHKTSFNYQIKNQGLVTFKVYNALGQLVKTLVKETKPAGAYQVEWDGKDGCGLKVSSGVYIYRLQTGDFMETKKMVIIK
ncbi:DNRLRE domain-containing protein [candidate division TA06 bacterium]|nr:DNRLRE domain-containing protein [candidate division TA06 bacterium]